MFHSSILRLYHSSPLFFFFQIAAVLLLDHLLPAAPSLLQCDTVGTEMGGEENVPAKMTRCKPDQGECRFGESATAGLSVYVK